MPTHSPYVWGGFIAFVIALLALDLGVFNRKQHVIGVREALMWSVIWIAISVLFGVGVWHYQGEVSGKAYFLCYVMEKALSVDNLFVFLAIFSFFAVPAAYQHRVLFWGILGALVMRAAFIYAGSELILKYNWILYVFGGFLVFTGIKLLFHKGEAANPDKSLVVRAVRAVLPVAPHYDGAHFWTRVNGKLMATPLLLVLIAIEATDVVFAVDSVPAAIAAVYDPAIGDASIDTFVIYTSNIMAILGLRALYFALAAMERAFRYLKYGLAAILVFIGLKMMLSKVVGHVDITLSLGIVFGLLGASVLASLIAPPRHDGGNPV